MRADLAATAHPVLDAIERRHVFAAIIDDLNQPRHSAYLAQPMEPLDEWVEGSPLIRVSFAE